MDLPDDPYEAAALAASQMVDRLGRHGTAVVLGSGWADVATDLGSTTSTLDVATLRGAVEPSVTGHHGTIRSVDPGGGAEPVLVLAGRIHLYEGHDARRVVHMVRAAVLAGCTRVVLTNAAGSLRADVPVGSPVLIADHLNLTGANPMCGPEPTLGSRTRFVDLTDLYSPTWRGSVRELHPTITEGVYAGLLGGSFETPAEIRMLAALGADLVGMSTVLEAIAARQLGAEVLGISLVTNLAAGLQDRVDHAEVLAAGRASLGTLSDVLRAAVGRP